MTTRGSGIYLRGRTWWLDFTHFGNRHVLRLGKSISRTVAGEIAQVERSKILRGEAGIGRPKSRDISFELASEEFLKWAQANRKPQTAAFYSYCLKALSRSFSGKRLSEVHPFLIEKHKQMRLKEGHRVGVNRELATLKALFNRCREWKKFGGENPVRAVKKVHEPLTKVRFLSEKEESALMSAAAEHIKPVLVAGLYAGLRIEAEALTLKWDNVDLHRRLITIEAVYSKNRETQTIPIHSKLFAVLQQLWSSRKSEYVFAKPDGEALQSIRTAFTRACQRAKLSGVTPHTLRHTYASRLAMGGVNDVTLQALGRWKEPKMIRRYAHLSQEHLAQAIEKISSESPTLFTTPKAHLS